MPRVAIAWLAAVAYAVALVACGESDEPPARPGAPQADGIALTIRYDDGAGTASTGRLTCRAGEQRAEGALAGRAPARRLCARARALTPLLTRKPPARRACTQIYGGPETARATGTIDRRRVDRRFTRANGCEIADFTRAAGLLAP